MNRDDYVRAKVMLWMADGSTWGLGEVLALVTPLGAVVAIDDSGKIAVFSPTVFKRAEVEPVK